MEQRKRANRQSNRQRSKGQRRTLALCLGLAAIACGCVPLDLSNLSVEPVDRSVARAETAQPDNSFQKALEVGYEAAVAVQTARSPAQWRAVVERWQRAIALLEAIPPGHPQAERATNKIAEYRRNLQYAEGQLVREVPAGPPPRFLVLAGGGSPWNTEIALENNVLYFQRLLARSGYDPATAAVFFAAGNDGSPTIRYVDEYGQEWFKASEIPHVRGAATARNVRGWLEQATGDRPVFFYFTGHGIENPKDLDNNAMLLWDDGLWSVRQFASDLERLPNRPPVVAVMAQCYSGSFANFIYEGGDPRRPLAAQTRCGFFATVRENPSVGCTPEIDESTYRDYSSSFFAGLSGRTRTGEPAPSADYNGDGRVSYAEAHAFAKVDDRTIDIPVSTSEVWLRRPLSEGDRDRILRQPIADLLADATPERRYAVEALLERFNGRADRSYRDNRASAPPAIDEVTRAYWQRLELELLALGAEQQIRASGNDDRVAALDRLQTCEAGFWP